MSQTVVPMIHVPDVRATAEWYTSIGFKLVRQNEEDGEINWAKMSSGNSEVMFQSGGKPSTEHRREVDLYILTGNVDDLHRRLQDRVQVVEDPHDTFYGMREFIIRDFNRFWITFGQPIQTWPCSRRLAHATRIAPVPPADLPDPVQINANPWLGI